MMLRHAILATIWLGCSVTAVSATLTAEFLLHRPHRIGWHALLSMFSFATLVALLLSASLAAAHLLWLWAGRRSAHRGLLVSTGIVTLCALLPTWEVASFLTSGQAISKHPWVLELRWLFFALLLPLYPTVWAWHRIGTSGAALSPRASRVTMLSWAAFGVALTAGVFLIVGDSRLRAYGAFARYLLALGLVAPPTLLSAALRARPTLRWAPVVCGLLLAVAPTSASERDMSRGRTIVLGRSLPAQLVEMQLRRAPARHPGLDVASQRNSPCRPPERAPSRLDLSPAQRKNVILIGIDALRADFIGRSVGGTEITPNLERWSRAALRFPNAVTPQPRTRMALAAVAYGLDPMSAIGAAPAAEHLVGLMRRHTGHQLYVFPEYLRGAFPLDNDDTRFLDDTEATTDALLGALDAAGDAGLFAWVHYIAPHLPHEDRLGLNLAPPPLGPYASEVVSVDRSLGRLFDALERNDRADDTLVVVFSDHGYSLGEGGYHGYWSHLHRASVNVPLMLSGPGVDAGQASSIATMKDIAPTVLEFLGATIPETMYGISLFEQRRSPRTAYVIETHSVAAEIDPGAWQHFSLDALAAAHRSVSEPSTRFLAQVAAIDLTWQLKVDRITGRAELYRLDDLDEAREMSATEGPAARRLRHVLEAWERSYAHEAYCAFRYGR